VNEEVSKARSEPLHELLHEPLRIFLAGLAHETNSFSPLPTTLESFELGLLHRPGDQSTLEEARQFSGYGDLLNVAAEHGDDVVAGLCAWAQPSGLVARRAYESLRDELLAGLRSAGRVDMVFLVLHGAMIADGYPDCEGDLLKHVRAIVGAATPVGALLDLHGNVTQAMIDSGAVIIACKEYPHTDYLHRARELRAILAAAARGGARPRTIMRRVPMLGLFGTTEDPMHGFVRRIEACEKQAGILSISPMHGFPWSDTSETGAAIVIVCKDSLATEAAAIALADRLAAEFFSLRELAQARRLPVDEALDRALAARSPRGPVVIADGADNPGGGAASDSTFLLRAMIERRVENAALGMIWDPQAVLIAAAAGIGARLPLRIGGKVGPLSGDPVDVSALVLAVRADACQRGMDGRSRDPIGLAVAIRVDGIDIVLNSLRRQSFSPDCFTELGIDVAAKSLVVVKSTQHFRAGFDPLAAATVYCDARGSLNGALENLPYQHLRRPIWPLDPITSHSTEKG
jgi:microcystin degradation protein MlrC